MSDIVEITCVDGMSESMLSELPELTKSFIKQHIETYTFSGDDGEVLIETEKLELAYEELETMSWGITLASACAKGMVECAWDNEQNDMIFWTTNEEESE